MSRPASSPGYIVAVIKWKKRGCPIDRAGRKRSWAGKPAAVPYAHFGNPQSLNLYSYVENNPLSVADPDGHAPILAMSATAPPQCDLNACSSEMIMYGERGTAGNGIAPPTIPAPCAHCDPPLPAVGSRSLARTYPLITDN